MNLKAKALFLLSLTALSAPVIAEECNFPEQSGIPFQFDHLADFDHFSVRNQTSLDPVYPDWRYHPGTNSFLEYDKFFRRHAKLQLHPFLRKEEPVKGFADKTQPVRYYKAIVENCEVVWVRIPENSTEFERYFNVRDHKVDGNVSWLWEENTLNVRFTEQYLKLKDHEGKTIVSIPVTDNTILPAYPVDSNKLHAVPEFAKFTLTKVRDNAFSVAGHLRSPYSLYVTDAEGVQWRLPWDPEYLSLGDPLKGKKFSEGVSSSDIVSGNLVYGMTKSEVRLAWGAPHLERNHPIIKDSLTGQQYTFNENYLHDGTQKIPGERTFPISDGKKVGERTWWFYPNRLEVGQHLVFDINGKLTRDVQQKRIYKNRVEPVDVASKRLRAKY